MVAASSSKRKRPGGRSARVVSSVHTATLELLEEGGFENLQLPEVAERAKVNRTTVYRRWPTRVDLVVDLLYSFTDVNVPDPDTGSFEEDLVALLTEVADALSSRALRSLVRSTTEAAENDAQIRDAQHAFWERRFRLSGTIVERAIARRELAPDTDPRLLLELASGPVYFRALLTTDPVDDNYIALITRSMKEAYAPRSQP